MIALGMLVENSAVLCFVAAPSLSSYTVGGLYFFDPKRLDVRFKTPGIEEISINPSPVAPEMSDVKSCAAIMICGGQGNMEGGNLSLRSRGALAIDLSAAYWLVRSDPHAVTFCLTLAISFRDYLCTAWEHLQLESGGEWRRLTRRNLPNDE